MQEIGSTWQERAKKKRPLVAEMIRAEVEFGNAYNNCKGIGICRVITVSTLRSYKKACRACNKGIALVSKEDQYVRISFFKYSLNCKLIRKYFKGNSFQLEEDFELPKTIQKKLKLKCFTLQAGKYPVRCTRNYLTIVFDPSSPFKK